MKQPVDPVKRPRAVLAGSVKLRLDRIAHGNQRAVQVVGSAVEIVLGPEFLPAGDIVDAGIGQDDVPVVVDVGSAERHRVQQQRQQG